MSSRHLYIIVADIGHYDCGTGVGLELKITVNIGNCSIRGTLFHYSGSDNRLSVRIGNRSAHFDFLRARNAADEQEHCAQKEFLQVFHSKCDFIG